MENRNQRDLRKSQHQINRINQGLGGTMRLAALVSGGKDSALALNCALQEGHRITFLVSLVPKRKDSWMFHFPNIHLTEMFAEAAEIQLIKRETTGVKEEELEDLRLALETLDVEGVVSGAIASQYQKERIEEVCKKLNLRSFMPLWHQDPIELLEELLRLEFEVVFTGVSAYGFSEQWLGRSLSAETIRDLTDLQSKHQISPVGEGGEYETLVLDAPFFKKRMRLVETEIVWEKQSGYLHVTKALLVEK